MQKINKKNILTALAMANGAFLASWIFLAIVSLFILFIGWSLEPVFPYFMMKSVIISGCGLWHLVARSFPTFLFSFVFFAVVVAWLVLLSFRIRIKEVKEHPETETEKIKAILKQRGIKL